MKRNLILVVALAVVLTLPVGAFAEIKLTVAEIHPEDYPTTQGLFKFAELVKERSNGEIVIDVKYGGVLGKGEKKVVEQVQIGALDMARISLSPVMEFVPSMEAFGLPYIWKSQESMWKVLNGETGQKLLKAVEEFNFYGLCYYESGVCSFYNAKREIKSVADLKGLKIRVQSSELMIDLVNTLGANATPMAFGEVYDAISKGVIEGAENNWPSYESTGHYEVANWVEPGEIIEMMGYPLGLDTWGGGFIYGMRDNHICIGYLTSLDYKDPFMDPHREFQKLKLHPMVKELLKDGKMVQFGAKTAPVGGFYAVPKLTFDGGMIVGDGANLFNAMKIKGVNLAMRSGMLAAETIFQGLLKDDFSQAQLENYRTAMLNSDEVKDLYKVRNFHQALENGLIKGILTQTDLMKALSERDLHPTVSSAMQYKIEPVESIDMLQSAFDKFKECNCHTLPVTFNRRLVGLLTMDNFGEYMRIRAALAG